MSGKVNATLVKYTEGKFLEKFQLSMNAANGRFDTEKTSAVATTVTIPCHLTSLWDLLEAFLPRIRAIRVGTVVRRTVKLGIITPIPVPIRKKCHGILILVPNILS